MAFLVDLSALNKWEDIKSDMNGAYPHKLRCATWTVGVDAENAEVEILERKK